MNIRKLLLLLIIILICHQNEATLDRPFNVSLTEINILRRLSSSINQPISFDGLNVSSECRRASKHFLNGLSRLDLSALQMHDANAKMPSGILRGNIQQYGDFQLCLRSFSSNSDYRGQHCLTKIQLTLPNELQFINHLKQELVLQEIFKSTFQDVGFLVPRSSEIHWGLCVPSSCSPQEVEVFVNDLLHNVFDGSGTTQIDVEVIAKQCHVQDDDWISKLSFTTIAVNFFLAGFVVFVVGATVCTSISDSKVKSQWLASFSLNRNISDMFDTTSSDSNIRIIHGVRDYVQELATSILAYPFRAAYIYTDVFMMLSGLLLSHSIIGKLQKGITINYFTEIAGRYMRIMPPFAAVILFSTWTLPHIGAGPLWDLNTDEAELCQAYWWRNFLMVHNLFGIENICLPQTHHIATDFTLMVISLFLITFAYRKPKKGLMLIATLALMSTVGRFYVTYANNLNAYLFNGAQIVNLVKSADKMYFMPPYRFTAYALGILIGYIIRTVKHFKLTMVHKALGYSSMFLSLIFICYSIASNQEFDRFNQSLYASAATTAWCWIFAWLIFASHFGSKNFMIHALEWKYFKISTNLGYAFYLVQFTVFNYNIGTAQAPTHGTIFEVLFDLNELAVVVAAAFVLTIFVEIPFGQIKKLIFDPAKKKSVGQNKVK